MHSESIIRSPVALFLGAGATRPLGKLLMGEFIDLLEAAKGFKGRELFDKIVAKERDLEFLFEELEEWIGKEYFAPSVLPPLYGIVPPAGPDQKKFLEQFQGLVIQASSLQRDLRREVFSAYRDIEKREVVLPLFAPVFQAIFKHVPWTKHPIVVFTTNYDPAVEDFCELSAADYDLEDGFSHSEAAKAYLWERSQFDNFQISAKKKHIVLFKLHGSANWTKTGRGIIKSPAPIYVEGDSIHENVLIYPAKRKVAYDEPFFTAYDYYQRTLEHCALCIVIGYSFRDYDALTKLMSASARNTSLEVLVVDPSAKARCKFLSQKRIPASSVPRRFGDKQEAEQYLPEIEEAVQRAASRRPF